MTKLFRQRLLADYFGVGHLYRKPLTLEEGMHFLERSDRNKVNAQRPRVYVDGVSMRDLIERLRAGNPGLTAEQLWLPFGSKLEECGANPRSKDLRRYYEYEAETKRGEMIRRRITFKTFANRISAGRRKRSV